MAPGRSCVGGVIVREVGKRNTWADDELCARPSTAVIAGLSLCERHEAHLRAWLERQLDERIAADERARAETIEQAVGRRLLALEAEKDAAHREASVIYYVRRSDGLIKIGTTARFSHRMAALRKEHGSLKILLTHPGDRDREQQLHLKFRELRVEGEWFRNTKRLAMWIRKCRMDPAIAHRQHAAVVDEDALKTLLRDGIRASLAASAERRAACKVDHEQPDEMFARLIRDGEWPPQEISA